MTYRIPKNVVFGLGTLLTASTAALLAASCAQDERGEPLGKVQAHATIGPTITAAPTLTIVQNPCIFADCPVDTDSCTYHCQLVSGKAQCGYFPVECDDRNQCTTDACNRETGACDYVPNTQECTDSDPCTAGDQCREAKCVGNAVVCDDNNSCTTDSCAEGNCVFDPVEQGTSCNDQNGCTNSDECSSTGVCVGSGGPDCDDENPCTKNQCSNSTCYNTDLEPVGTPCLNPNKCLVNTACNAEGECTSTEEKNCDDANPCTHDTCDPDVGCVSEPDDTATCSDGDVCTQNDACVDGLCTPESGITCAPIDDCHETGECDPSNGLCSDPRKPDGETCETTGTCKSGRCEGGTPDPAGGAGGAPNEVGEGGAAGGDAPVEGGAPSVGAGGSGGSGESSDEGGEDAGGTGPAATGGRGVVAPAPDAGEEGDDDNKQVFKRDPGGCTVGGASAPTTPGLTGLLVMAGLALAGLRRQKHRR